jgi:hypothetical protein
MVFIFIVIAKISQLAEKKQSTDKKCFSINSEIASPAVKAGSQ